MTTLYYSPGACSMAVHVALNECNQPVTLEKVDIHGGNPSPEFLKLNPRGQVPVLVDDGQTIVEGAAILIHVLEKNNSPLLPKSGKERDQAIQWLMFANASMHPSYGRTFFLMKNKAPDAILEASVAGINKLWASVETQLASQPYVCGQNITVADILLTVIANWSGNLPKPVELGPNTKKMLKAVSSRPAYQKAMTAEHTEYKAAA